MKVLKADMKVVKKSATNYCRKLIENGEDPDSALEIYRGDVLCIKIKNIGDLSKLALVEEPRLHYVKYRPPMKDRSIRE